MITLSALGLIAIIAVSIIGGVGLAWHVHASYMAMNERDRRFVRDCEVDDEAENGECR